MDVVAVAVAHNLGTEVLVHAVESPVALASEQFACAVADLVDVVEDHYGGYKLLDLAYTHIR